MQMLFLSGDCFQTMNSGGLTPSYEPNSVGRYGYIFENIENIRYFLGDHL